MGSRELLTALIETASLRSLSLDQSRVGFVIAACIIAWIGGCAAASSYAAEDQSLDAPRIYWRNGDTLDGAMHWANAEQLLWNSRIFADPLRLRREAIQMIRFPVQPREFFVDVDEAQAQTIETRDGNRFFGIVTDSTSDTLTVETHQYGEVRIRRNAVSLMVNPVQRAHVYSGPKGLRGWSTLTYGRKLSEWEELPGGRLTTKMVAAELYRSLPANGSVDIDVEFIWRHNPSFQIRFLTPYKKSTKETVKLETRATNYVIQTLGSNGRFRQLDNIPKETTKCRFFLRWNHAARELAVYRARRYLGKINVEEQEGMGTAGIYIKNTGPQLTLSRLEVRARSKLDMNLTDPTQDTILRADNQSFGGRVTAITKDTVTFIDSEQNSINLPWSDIPEISFRQRPSEFTASPGNTECIFQNGETLKGRLLQADEQGLTIKVPALDESIRCRYDGMDRIIFNPKAVPPAKHAPKLRAGDIAIHGCMAATARGQIGWMPVGGVESVRLAEHVSARFECQPIQSSGTAKDDVVYLRSGDVIPCQVIAADAAQLTLSSRFAQNRVLPAQDIKAIELSAAPMDPIMGFDRHWQAKDAARAKIDETSVSFIQPTVVRHPHILKGSDQIEFVVSRGTATEGGSFLQVTLHGEQDEERAIPFYLSGNQSFVMGNRGNAFQLIPGDADSFSVAIQMRHPFSISVNGVVVKQTESSSHVEQLATPWLGLSFALTPRQPLARRRVQTQGDASTVLTISDLVVSQTLRPAISHTTAALDSKPLLTVPRHRDSKSVTHLAVGANNDIVRGRLLKLDAKTVQLESGSIRMEIPREALSGLIWLGNEERSDPKEFGMARVVLHDTTTFGLERPTLNERELQGHHSQLGACKIAVDEIHTVLWGSAPNHLHNYEFLGWTAMDAVQPIFVTDEGRRHQIETDLVGKRLDLVVELIDSPNPFRLSEQLGRVVIIEFWATWCAPCVRSMPKLVETVRHYSPEEVEFVAVNQGESPLAVATMVAAKGWDMATGLDPASHASKIFRVEALPQTVVVDRDGKIAAVFVGATSDLQVELRSTIDRLLEE